MRVLAIFLLSILLPTFAHAIFDENGKFEETWDFQWTGESQAPLSRWTMNALFSYEVRNGEYTLVTPSAKNPLSSGQSGLRLWYPDSDLAAGYGPATSSPASPFLSFNGAQPELWVRYYVRYQEGFNWLDGSPHYDKQLRLWTHTHGGDPNIMIHMEGNEFGIVTDTSITYWNQRVAGYGWASKFTDNGTTSHGRWVCVEIHIKMESAAYANDGVLRIWMDGELIKEKLDMGYVNPDATTQGTPEAQLAGWVHMHMDNQNNVQNISGPIGRNVAYVDFDDIVIYNQTPPNTDTSGNPFIGPIGWTSGPVDGVCGTANGGTFSSAPTSKLCSGGTPTVVIGPDPGYSWTCEGTGGSTVNAPCSATYEEGSNPPTLQNKPARIRALAKPATISAGKLPARVR